MHTEKPQKKKGTRSRKRKAASSATEHHERDAATVAGSVQSSPPHSCLTQNSDGRFVPRFSKKLRSASKVPSAVTSSPAPATSELQSQQHSATTTEEEEKREAVTSQEKVSL